MEDTFRYLNTDLDVISTDDLTALAAAFEMEGTIALHCERGEDGIWCARFEVDQDLGEPEPAIAAILAVIESFEESLRAVWSGCKSREFNIGYDCGSKPWAFNQGLSCQLLGRIAAAGASLRITLYPPEREKSAANEPV